MRITLLIFILVVFLSLTACDNPNSPEIKPFPAAESGPQNISYDLLKEVFPGSNSISENKINLIFDCRNMNKVEFESCVNYLWRFFNDEPSNIPDISFGLFQIEPFKSNQDQFKVWYLDRNLMNPNFTFNTKNQSCDKYDTSFYYASSLQNVILINLCQGEYSDASSTLFPIKEKTQVTLTKEKEAGMPIDLLGPGNIKSVVSMGVNKNEMREMGQDPAALGLSGVFTHEIGHALGGLIDEYSHVPVDNPVDKEKTNIEPPSKLQEFEVKAEFPNCAPNIKTADLWWKETGLIPNNQNYTNGCAGNHYILPYKYTWMSKNLWDSSGNLAISSADELFSPIHRYWICRNIHNMTGLVEGVCQDFSELGFNGLLYTSGD